MKKLLTNILDFTLFSNIFIGLCAVCQGLVTYYLLSLKPDLSVLLILFSGTIFTYNFSVILIKPQQVINSSFKRLKWFSKFYYLYILLTVLSLTCSAYLFFRLKADAQTLLLALGVICVLYSLPFLKKEKKHFGIRNLPYLKLFLIATVWALSCVLLPVLQTGNLIPDNNIWLLIVKRFLFITAITIPFDIRDLYQDKLLDLKTIPVKYGEKKALIFCLALLIAYLLLLVLFQKRIDLDFIALSITILISGWLIFKANFQKNEYYYFLGLDGILILQYLLLMVSGSFK